MLLALVAFAGIGVSQSVEAKEYLSSGAYLVRSCEAVVRQHPTAKESFSAAVCMAYIEGFTDADHAQCAWVSYGTMASVYVAYMRQHPELMQMPKSVGLSISLRACPETKWIVAGAGERRRCGSSFQPRCGGVRSLC